MKIKFSNHFLIIYILTISFFISNVEKAFAQTTTCDIGCSPQYLWIREYAQNEFSDCRAAGTLSGTHTFSQDCSCTTGSTQPPYAALGISNYGSCSITPTPISPSNSPNSPQEEQPIDPFEELYKETLDTLNPLLLGGSDGDDVTVFEESEQATTLSKPGGIINRALDFAFPLAGLILFIMITFGGFQMLTGAAGKKDIEAGKKRVTAAIVGFMLLFASYWIIQILEKILGLNILNS